MPKEGFREYCAGRQLSSITMGVGNAESIVRQSQIPIFNNNLYEGDFVRKLADYGILDRRLGTNQKDVDCLTCGLSLTDCVGHYGYIDLELPVFHVGYFPHVINVLKTICKKCSRVLLDQDAKSKFYSRIINNPNLTYTQKKNYRKQILVQAQKIHKCPYCKYTNGMVKKVTPGFKLGTIGKPVLKIVHIQFRSKEVTEKMLDDYKSAIELNSDLKPLLKTDMAFILTPVEVLKLFERIPISDINFLLMDNSINHPKDLILTRIIVPPVCIRPSVKCDLRAGTTEDDLTMKLNEIILMNNYVKKYKHSSQVNTNITLYYDAWDMLQIIAALYINSEMSGIPYSMMPKKNGRGLIQRIKGKKGRFRGNLSGKRVDFTSRTVISPDPYLEIDQVGIPIHVAKILTFPHQVTEANIKFLRKLVTNGPLRWPGANYIIMRNNEKKFLMYGNREKFATDLQPGDIVERHLMNNDIVLFNRQPSLHTLSIMSLRVKVHKYRTFRFNECNCTPYNADFDGDEMNVHVPQTLEAKAEAAILMANKSNLVTPKNGEILIGAIQDFLTSSFLLTKKFQFFDYNGAIRLLSSIFSADDPNDNFELPKPAILFPKQLWTGKQLISLIMRPNKQNIVKVNLNSPGKAYTSNREFCKNESFVIIRNSELLAGTLDKGHLGSSGKTGNIFYLILRDYGESYSIKAMSRLSKLSSNFLTNSGLSLGIEDVTANKTLKNETIDLLKKGYAKCENIIKDMNEGKLQCQPGCDEEQTLETFMLNELSVIRDDSGKSCSQKLPRNNAPLIMATCGSKGSFINVAQMVMCVGQQAINSKRVPDHFDDRPVFYFDRKVKFPKAKGFVENSFNSGLVPSESLYHASAGREGLVDTAVKTAETGYMQRRLVKCLEDLTVSCDNTVRNSENEVVQFVYGGDGLNPALMEGNGVPVDFARLYQHTKSCIPGRDEITLTGDDVVQISKEYLESTVKCEPGFAKDKFRYLLTEFLKNEATKINKCFNKYGTAGYQVHRVTKNQLITFIKTCFKKYERALVEPTTAVGALAATSIGEPGTQMTLKTFHFAGVASMNITQGVPRIKEIINVNKNISTPIIQAALLIDNDEEYAIKTKARIEKTTLGDVIEYYKDKYHEKSCFAYIKLDLKAIESLRQNIDAQYIRQKILKHPKLNTCNVYVEDNKTIVIYSNNDKAGNLNMEMHRIREQLNNILIAGCPTVSRVVITPTQENKVTRYHLCVESENLRDVMATYGVNPNKTFSNHIYEVAKTLGIEACKSVIMDEIKMVMENHGMSVDIRHIMLLASQMTHTGDILGITRYGLAKMKQSVLNLASFEQTADHLFDAGYHGQTDKITGVSANVITGMPAPIGTGILELLEKKCFKMPAERKVAIFQKHFNY